jgi:hypothetical protein
MGNRDMPKPVLNAAGIGTIIGQLITATMPQHMEVNRHRQFCPLADILYQPIDGVLGERHAALGREYIAAIRVLFAQSR